MEPIRNASVPSGFEGVAAGGTKLAKAGSSGPGTQNPRPGTSAGSA